jgi:Ser/Thr protein kinase RdoA (MazF antagonist)
MLLADFGPALRSNPDHSLREEALCTFAALQQAAVQHVGTLLARGCRDRRLHVLAAQIEPLLHDPIVLAGLQAEERCQLHELVPQLHTMCHALAAYRIPQTLVHGDLHPGNIAGGQGAFRFFDWTDGCIAHPFFDLVVMLADAAVRPDASEVCPRLCDSYLALWTAYEPLARAQEAWQLAEPLGALHHAVSYQHIVTGLEPTAQHELAWGVSFWLRKVLQVLSRDHA